MLHPSSRSILTGFLQSRNDISYLLIEKSRLAIRYSTCNTCTDSCTRRKYWNKQRFIFFTLGIAGCNMPGYLKRYLSYENFNTQIDWVLKHVSHFPDCV